MEIHSPANLVPKVLSSSLYTSSSSTMPTHRHPWTPKPLVTKITQEFGLEVVWDAALSSWGVPSIRILRGLPAAAHEKVY